MWRGGRRESGMRFSAEYTFLSLLLGGICGSLRMLVYKMLRQLNVVVRGNSCKKQRLGF